MISVNSLIRIGEKKIITQDPFQSLDQTGVGQLIQLAEKARRTKPNMSIGVCGEVGGDPQSITFFQTLGLNYISCSPYRVPIAKPRSCPSQNFNRTGCD